MGTFRENMKKTLAMILAVTMITLLPQNSLTVFAEESVKTTEETLVPTETPIEAATEVPIEAATEVPTEAATETPTEAATETPTEAATETPTEIPAETVAEVPAETPVKTPEETLAPIQELMSSDDEMQVVYEEGSEGVYQKGAFSVLGESEDSNSDVELVRIVNREEAEEFFYQSLLVKKARIDMSKYQIPVSEIRSFVYGVINDHPDLYYARVGFSYTFSGNIACKIRMDYQDGYDDAAFNTAVEDAMSVIDDTTTDLEKAIKLHDYIVLNCEYNNNKEIPANSYSAYGVFVERTAVCQGYALAYKLLLNKAGIECYMVTSDSMNHAWNLVCLDGKYYQVDVTWDDPTLDSIGLAMHKYMFVSDKTFQSTAAKRTAHSNWTVTKGSQVVNLAAEDVRYDNAFWVNGYSPLLIEDGNCYYIKSDKNYYTNTIQKRDLSTGAEKVILKDGYLGDWWNLAGAYSGLLEINEGLYFNSCDKIYRVSKEGGVPVAMTEKLSTDNALVCGIVLQEGKVKYSLKTKYPYYEEGSVATAVLKEQVSLEINKITITPEKMALKKGDSKLLTIEVFPSYVEKPAFTWTTSDSEIATVDDGLVTAAGGEGKCIITASVGDKSASCEIIVRNKLAVPVFSHEGGYIDKNSAVSITSADGAEIYYTIDGSTPDVANTAATKKYTAPIVIDKDMTIKAIAVSDLEEIEDSDMMEASFIACSNKLMLEKTKITLKEGETQNIAVTQIPTLKDITDVKWASSNPSVATVEETTGEIKAIYEGTADIIASVTNYKNELITATCQVTVEAPYYTVTFCDWNGKILKAEKVKARTTVAPPDVLLPKGYEFTEWRVDNKTVDISNMVILKDTTITMYCEPTKYRIIYHTNGGNAKSEDNYTVESNNFELGNATGKKGYLFDGWYRNEQLTGDRVYEIAKGSTGDIELFAAWKDERGLWMQAEGSSNPDEIPAQNYTGKAIKPGFVIYFGAKELKAGKDYTVSYKNNKAANLLETDADKSKAPTVIIKGKGNYAGTLTKTFQILKKNIEDVKVVKDVEDGEGEGSDKVYEIRIDDLAAAYKNGKAILPVPTVIHNGKKLANKKDFTVTYPDIQNDENAYKEPGIYRVQIDGCGNYEGTRTIQFTITNPETEKLISKVKIAKIPDQTYTGSPVSLTEDILKLTDGAYELKLTEDYTVKYAEGDDGTNVGTHSLIITGKDKYAGVKRITFKVTGTAISTAAVGNLPKLTYTGEALEFDPEAEKDAENKLVITDREGNPLKEYEDYTLSFSNNVNVGKAKMVVKGINKYTGSMTKTFKIVPDTLANTNDKVQVTFANGSEKQLYEKGGAKPEVIVTYRVKDETVTLKEGVDYTVSYKNNTSADEKEDKLPTVTIKGKKNFNGSRTMTFSIEKKDIKNVNIMAPDLEENTRAGKYMSVPVLTDENGKKLKAGTDYEKTYEYRDAGGTLLDSSSRPEAGSSITVTVKGTGNYTGTASCTFRIVEKGKLLSKSKVTVKNKIYYNGGKVTLTKDDLKVMSGNVELDKNSYTITGYSKNDRKGTARVTIQGTGDYGGTKTISFKILSHSMKWWENLKI